MIQGIIMIIHSKVLKYKLIFSLSFKIITTKNKVFKNECIKLLNQVKGV